MSKFRFYLTFYYAQKPYHYRAYWRDKKKITKHYPTKDRYAIIGISISEQQKGSWTPVYQLKKFSFKHYYCKKIHLKSTPNGVLFIMNFFNLNMKGEHT